jgi:hypothetical protein
MSRQGQENNSESSHFVLENPGARRNVPTRQTPIRSKKGYEIRIDNFLEKMGGEVDWLDNPPTNESVDRLCSILTALPGFKDLQGRGKAEWEDILDLCEKYKRTLEGSSKMAFFQLLHDAVCVVALESGHKEDAVDQAMRRFYSLSIDRYTKYVRTKRMTAKYAIKVIELFVSHFGDCAYTLPCYGEARPA